MLLHEHACFTPARVPSIRTRVLLSHAYSTFVGPSRSRRGYSAPKCASSSHTRIPLPHVYSAPECVSRLYPCIAFLHACPSYAGVSHSRTRVFLLILDHISVPNWRAHINCLGRKDLKFKKFTFEYFNAFVRLVQSWSKKPNVTPFSKT